MSHTHITLVGGQPIPVYQGIIHSKPDWVVFVCSEQSIREAEAIQREISVESEIYIIDPVDLAVIERKSKELRYRLEGQHTSLNITSGTKPWAFYFVQAFGSDENCEIFYVDQNTLVRSFKDFTKHVVNLDADVRFRLHGNPLDDYMHFEEFETDDFESISRIREMRKFNYRDFNQLTKAFSENSEEVAFRTNNGSRLTWNEADSSIDLMLYNNRGEFKSDHFMSAHTELLFTNTGWFELEVAAMLSRWNKSRHVRLNCVFPTKANSPKNEIDIIVDTGTKLLFVECKTQIYSITDIDKFASAVKVYGGYGSKSLFVTDAVMRDNALEKCKDNRTLSFSIQTDWRHAEKKLHELLDKELYNINL